MKREDFENIEDYIEALEDECRKAKEESIVRKATKASIAVGEKIKKNDAVVNMFKHCMEEFPIYASHLAYYPRTFLEILKGRLDFNLIRIYGTEGGTSIDLLFNLTNKEYLRPIEAWKTIDLRFSYTLDFNSVIRKDVLENEVKCMELAEEVRITPFFVSKIRPNDLAELFGKCEDILKQKED